MARVAAIGAVAALAVAGSAQTAQALAPVLTDTTIIVTPLTSATATYSGRVTTKTKNKGGLDKRARKRAARRCVKGRDIDITFLGADIGRAVTDKSGNWTVTGTKPAAGTQVRVHVSRDVRGDVLCGVILKSSLPVP